MIMKDDSIDKMSENNKEIVKLLYGILNKYSMTKKIVMSFMMDLQLLPLQPEEDKIMEYCNSFNIIPGYSKYFSTIALLSNNDNSNTSRISSADMLLFNSLLEKMSLDSIKTDGEKAIAARQYAQNDWQKKYIFKTYLLSLFLNENKIKQLFNGLNLGTVDDLISLALIPRLASEKIFLKYLCDNEFSPGNLFMGLSMLIKDNYKFLAIEHKDFKQQQIEKLEKANYNLFYTRMISKNYPIIKFRDDLYFFSAFFYLQDAIFSRIIRLISNKGVFTKDIGKAFEMIIHKSFIDMYSHCDVVNTEKRIVFNPNTKKSGELCDILIPYKGRYLLIDCKSQEMIEDIFIDNSKELEYLCEKYTQRIDRIRDIKNRKFSKYIPASCSMDNVYSLIAFTNNGTLTNNQVLSFPVFQSIDEAEKAYYIKHIYTISYDDLLDVVCSDVDLLSEIINRTSNDLIIDIKTKKEYSQQFNLWYKQATDKMKEFLYKLLIKTKIK